MGAGERRAGFTLIELILVMAILAIVVGTGLGMFATFDPGRRAAVGLVENALRRAHNTAVARRAPASVHVDRAAGTMRVEGFEVCGTWHFETEALEGARDLDGTAHGFPQESLTDHGFQGRALDLAKGARDARVTVDVQRDPLVDPRYGFAIEVAVRPAGDRGGALVDLGGAVQITALRGGAVEARFVARRVDELGRPVPGEKVALRTAGGILRVDRWTRLSCVYDRRALRLFADDVQVAVRPVEHEVWELEGGLVVGGGVEPFEGALDALVLSVVSGSEVLALPDSVAFDAATPAVVRFAPGGALDPLLHPGPVRVGLVFDDGTTAEVRVQPFGTVE